MATIAINDMRFYAHHGCFEQERAIGTHFRVDLEFVTDTSRAEVSDNIADTVNFKRWYFGHHHIDVSDAYPYTALYQEIVELDLYGNSRFNEDGEASADYEAVWNNNYFD